MRLLFMVTLLLPVFAFAKTKVPLRGPAAHHFPACAKMPYPVYRKIKSCKYAVAEDNAGQIAQVGDEIAVQTTVKDLQPQIAAIFAKPIAERQQLLNCFDSDSPKCKTLIDGVIKFMEIRHKVLRASLIIEAQATGEFAKDETPEISLPGGLETILPDPTKPELKDVEIIRKEMVARLMFSHQVRNADGKALEDAELDSFCASANSQSCAEYYSARSQVDEQLHKAGGAVVDRMISQTPFLRDITELPISQDKLKEYLKASLDTLKEKQDHVKNPASPAGFLVEFEGFLDSYLKDHQAFCQGVDLTFNGMSDLSSNYSTLKQYAPLGIGCTVGAITSWGLVCVIGVGGSAFLQTRDGYVDYKDKRALFLAMTDLGIRTTKELDKSAEARKRAIEPGTVDTAFVDMMINGLFNVSGMVAVGAVVGKVGVHVVLRSGVTAATPSGDFLSEELGKNLFKESEGFVAGNTKTGAFQGALDKSVALKQDVVTEMAYNLLMKAYGL